MSEKERRYKVLVTHSSNLDAGIRLLREKCDVTICNSLPQPTREEILNKSKGMDGIFWATHVRLDAEALDCAGPQLKAISVKSAGLDYVDVSELKRRGIPLGYTPLPIVEDSVADIAIGLMIAAGRCFRKNYLRIINNEWIPFGNPVEGRDIKGSTVGIVGLGGIGQAIARRLKGFDIGTLLYTGPREKEEGKQLGAIFVELDELLIQSDFIIVSCPLNNETRHLFNKSAFDKMKDTSVFVNVARGGLVVQEDLVDALKNGSIFAAGLDVMTPEPLPFDHELTKLSNCVLLTHSGCATQNARDNMSIVAAQNILNGMEGKPLLYSAY